MRRAQLRLVGLALVPVAALALLATTAPAAAAPAVAPAATTVAGERYVALGDSYAAGLGLKPPDTAADASACGRSTSNYPHQVATALGLDLVDVTCSGAVIADLSSAQDASRGITAPQFDALTADTRLVTLTIGGNDLGFSSIAAYCATLTGPSGPVRGGDGSAADCRSHYDPGGDDTLADDLTNTVRPALDAALATIKSRAPDAKIVVVDYPAIVPDKANTPSGGCWTNPLQVSDSLPFTDTDLPYLQQIEARLDQTLSDAATAAGAGVATAYTASLAHTACSSSPWVNGVRIEGLATAPSSLHPNFTGASELAAAAIPVARTLLAGGTASTPPSVASAGDDSGSGVPGWVWGLVAVGVLLVVVIGVGAFRVARRRR